MSDSESSPHRAMRSLVRRRFVIAIVGGSFRDGLCHACRIGPEVIDRLGPWVRRQVDGSRLTGMTPLTVPALT